MMRQTLAAVAFVAAAAAPVLAQAPPAPKPAPEMASLKFMEGSWTCAGTMPASPFGPGGKTTSSVSIHNDLGGFWQSGTVKASGGGMPGTMEGMFHTTYDTSAKQYVMLWVDNMGAWAQSTAKGWENDTLTYTGETIFGGQKIASRDSFKKNADGSLHHTSEMQMEGKWANTGDETCKKAAKK